MPSLLAWSIDLPVFNSWHLIYTNKHYIIDIVLAIRHNITIILDNKLMFI